MCPELGCNSQASRLESITLRNMCNNQLHLLSARIGRPEIPGFISNAQGSPTSPCAVDYSRAAPPAAYRSNSDMSALHGALGSNTDPRTMREPAGSSSAHGAFWFAGPAPTGTEDEPTMAILATDANAAAKPLHGRMPVVLPADAVDAWLDPDAITSTLQNLLMPVADELIEIYHIRRAVNSPQNNGPELVERLTR